MALYNVKDFGAVGNGVAVDKAAIQAAMDAAYNAGGGDVYLPTGVYLVEGGENGDDSGALHIRDNVHVYGDGMGLSVIKVRDGWDGKITGVMRTPYAEGAENVSVRDLTLDGNRANTSGKIDGWFNGYAPGEVGQDANVTLDRVEIMNMSGYGFDPHEQTYNLIIRNSISHGNGLDGFVADFIRGDSHYENNLAYDNDRHGFNIVTSTSGLGLLNNIAHDNGGAGIVVQRGSEDIPLVNNVTIAGGELYGNALEGIQVKITDGVTITGVDIHHNGTNGIRIYGSTGVLVVGNNIYNNSQSKHNGYAEIRLQEYNESSGVSGLLFDADGNIVRGNTIYSDGAIRANYGIEETAGRADYNLFYGNSITGVIRGNLLLTGAHTQTLTPDIIGTAGSNSLSGTSANNLVSAEAGNDTVNAGAGHDTVYGGAGHDTLSGGDGNDLLFGGEGNDSLNGGSFAENDTLFGGTGNDTMLGGPGNDWLDGGSGNDSMVGGSGNEFMEGWYGNDTLIGENGTDNISGGHGDDSLSGGNDGDTLDGGAGKDTLTGGAAADVFKFSTQWHSVLTGGMYDFVTDFATSLDKMDVSGLGFTTLTGNPTTGVGELRLYFNAGLGRTFVRSDQTDFTFALSGNLTGSVNNNHFIFTAPVVTNGTLTGSAGNDTLTGTAADELLLGLGGNDSLIGGAGNDTLDGGAGKDTLLGGVGADIYRFSSLTDSVATDNNFDRITGFEIGVDKLNLTGLGFTGLDTDGGNTETGELRLVYSSTSNRTYIRSDQSSFEFYLDGNHLALTNSSFIFDAAPPPGATLTGGAGNDTLTGTGLDELLLGMAGNDSLIGGAGNDTLEGGAGKDTLIGGAGADVFTFSDLTHSVETGIMDRISGFVHGVDKLDVSGLGFTGLDTDGGNTEIGEFRLAYSTSDRTYVRSDQSLFEFYLDGDYRTLLTNSDFIYSA